VHGSKLKWDQNKAVVDDWAPLRQFTAHDQPEQNKVPLRILPKATEAPPAEIDGADVSEDDAGMILERASRALLKKQEEEEEAAAELDPYAGHVLDENDPLAPVKEVISTLNANLQTLNNKVQEWQPTILPDFLKPESTGSSAGLVETEAEAERSRGTTYWKKTDPRPFLVTEGNALAIACEDDDTNYLQSAWAIYAYQLERARTHADYSLPEGSDGTDVPYSRWERTSSSDPDAVPLPGNFVPRPTAAPRALTGIETFDSIIKNMVVKMNVEQQEAAAAAAEPESTAASLIETVETEVEASEEDDYAKERAAAEAKVL